MKNNSPSIAGAACLAAGAAIAVAAVFSWGMAVGNNDKRLVAEADQRLEMAARGVCGKRASLARMENGHYLCVYTNPDGATITRPVFDLPLGNLGCRTSSASEHPA